MQTFLCGNGFTGILRSGFSETHTMASHDTAIVLVLTTFPADADTEAVGRALLADRLVACMNVLPPMRSMYRWEGQVETADERQVILKTRASQVAALQARLAELHSYQVPELLVVPVIGGGDAYLAWVAAETAD